MKRRQGPGDTSCPKCGEKTTKLIERQMWTCETCGIQFSPFDLWEKQEGPPSFGSAGEMPSDEQCKCPQCRKVSVLAAAGPNQWRRYCPICDGHFRAGDTVLVPRKKIAATVAEFPPSIAALQEDAGMRDPGETGTKLSTCAGCGRVTTVDVGCDATRCADCHRELSEGKPAPVPLICTFAGCEERALSAGTGAMAGEYRCGPHFRQLSKEFQGLMEAVSDTYLEKLGAIVDATFETGCAHCPEYGPGECPFCNAAEPEKLRCQKCNVVLAGEALPGGLCTTCAEADKPNAGARSGVLRAEANSADVLHGQPRYIQEAVRRAANDLYHLVESGQWNAAEGQSASEIILKSVVDALGMNRANYEGRAREQEQTVKRLETQLELSQRARHTAEEAFLGVRAKLEAIDKVLFNVKLSYEPDRAEAISTILGLHETRVNEMQGELQKQRENSKPPGPIDHARMVRLELAERIFLQFINREAASFAEPSSFERKARCAFEAADVFLLEECTIRKGVHQ